MAKVAIVILNLEWGRRCLPSICLMSWNIHGRMLRYGVADNNSSDRLRLLDTDFPHVKALSRWIGSARATTVVLLAAAVYRGRKIYVSEQLMWRLAHHRAVASSSSNAQPSPGGQPRPASCGQDKDRGRL